MLKKIQLGKLLLEKKWLTQEQVDSAIIRQSITGGKFGQTLIDLGFIEEDKLLQLLSEQWQIPFIDLSHYALDPAVVRRLPQVIARRVQAIILKEDEIGYLIGMVDPEEAQGIDDLQEILKKPLHFALVRKSDLLTVFNLFY